MAKITYIADELTEDPTEKNWKKLSSSLKSSKIAYYKIFFGKGKLSNTQDLRNSHLELYDNRKKMVATIPVFMKDGKKMTGATIYLRGLQILNG